MSASENDDYVPKRFNVTLLPGEAEPKTVEIDVIDDALIEKTEEFQVGVVASTISSVTWGDPISVNILDNDGISVILFKRRFVYMSRILGKLSKHNVLQHNGLQNVFNAENFTTIASSYD